MRLSDDDVMGLLRGGSALNAARQRFSSASARLERKCAQRVPPSPVEVRRLEFEAVAEILSAVGVALGPDMESRPAASLPDIQAAAAEIAASLPEAVGAEARQAAESAAAEGLARFQAQLLDAVRTAVWRAVAPSGHGVGRQCAEAADVALLRLAPGVPAAHRPAGTVA